MELKFNTTAYVLDLTTFVGLFYGSNPTNAYSSNDDIISFIGLSNNAVYFSSQNKLLLSTDFTLIKQPIVFGIGNGGISQGDSNINVYIEYQTLPISS